MIWLDVLAKINTIIHEKILSCVNLKIRKNLKDLYVEKEFHWRTYNWQLWGHTPNSPLTVEPSARGGLSSNCGIWVGHSQGMENCPRFANGQPCPGESFTPWYHRWTLFNDRFPQSLKLAHLCLENVASDSCTCICSFQDSENN